MRKIVLFFLIVLCFANTKINAQDHWRADIETMYLSQNEFKIKGCGEVILKWRKIPFLKKLKKPDIFDNAAPMYFGADVEVGRSLLPIGRYYNEGNIYLQYGGQPLPNKFDWLYFFGKISEGRYGEWSFNGFDVDGGIKIKPIWHTSLTAGITLKPDRRAGEWGIVSLNCLTVSAEKIFKWQRDLNYTTELSLRIRINGKSFWRSRRSISSFMYLNLGYEKSSVISTNSNLQTNRFVSDPFKVREETLSASLMLKFRRTLPIRSATLGVKYVFDRGMPYNYCAGYLKIKLTNKK